MQMFYPGDVVKIAGLGNIIRAHIWISTVFTTVDNNSKLFISLQRMNPLQAASVSVNNSIFRRYDIYDD